MTKIVDSILGFALGDAMGVFCKNRKREDLIANPIVKMEGFGAFGVPSGVWSDDTALVLATIDSLVCTHKIDYDDMMRRFYNWMNKGEYTATGIVFDVEDVTRDSLLKHFTRKADVFNCGDKVSNSNGSLKRILPIALYTFYDGMSDDDLLKVVREVSSLSNMHEYCIMGCFIFVKYVHFLLSGYDKFEAYQKVKDLNYYKFSENARRAYKRFLTTDIYKLDLDYIKSSCYVVDTLEAVIWTFLNTNSFMEGIIGAINLGGDTDTIGALSGALAGLSYGVNKDLLRELKNKDYLVSLANKFDEELRLNILKFDEVIDNKYGIIKGSGDVFFIKTGVLDSIYGHQNKYLKMAKRINYNFGLTVIVAANLSDMNLDDDFDNLASYLGGNDIYFMGISNGAMQGIQKEYNNYNVKQMLLVNLPLMINLHKTKDGIRNYKGKLTFVFGSKDPSFNYLPLIQDFRNVNVVIVPGQDHNFSKGDEFLYLPDKYLFNDYRVMK